MSARTQAAGPHIEAVLVVSSGKSQMNRTYRDAIGVLLPNTLGLGLALLKGVLVLKLGTHIDK